MLCMHSYLRRCRRHRLLQLRASLLCLFLPMLQTLHQLHTIFHYRRSVTLEQRPHSTLPPSLVTNIPGSLHIFAP